jgi:hypothetical protein
MQIKASPVMRVFSVWALPSDGKLNLVLVGDQTDLDATIFTWKTSRKQSPSNCPATEMGCVD